MPNWHFNEWELSGKPEAVKQAEATLLDNDQVDFNRLIPMPELLRKTCRVYNSEGPRLFIITDPDDPFTDKGRRLATPEEVEELRRIGDGHDDWYDWACSKWGTKWNGSNTEVDTTMFSNGFRSTTIAFQTAWCPPTGIIKAMAKRCKELDVDFHARSHGEDIWDCDYDSDHED